MAELVLAAMGRALAQGPALQAEWKPYLHTLAYRMGRNREIAGLHFESDSTAGYELAHKIMQFLESKFVVSQCLYIKQLVDDAAKEW